MVYRRGVCGICRGGVKQGVEYAVLKLEKPKGAYKEKISLTDFRAGLYQLNIITNNKIHSERIIIE